MNTQIYFDYYFGLCKLATMSPLGWHPPCAVDNKDTMYLGGPALSRESVGFLYRFLGYAINLLLIPKFIIIIKFLWIINLLWSLFWPMKDVYNGLFKVVDNTNTLYLGDKIF